MKVRDNTMMISLVFITVVMIVSNSSCGEDTASPQIIQCHTEKDSIYRGMLVDCRHRGITFDSLLKLKIQTNTTTLLLDYNELDSLTGKSLFRLGENASLKFLSLSHNKIKSICPYTFNNFSQLNKLDLSYNQIRFSRRSSDYCVFEGLKHLSELDISYNGMRDIEDNMEGYPDSLLSPLHSLITLSIEMFRGQLNFSSLFDKTTKLSFLTLSGGITSISNSSFECFKNIALKNLTIIDVPYLKETDSGAFQHLEHLVSFILSNYIQYLDVTLKSLAPFVNRNLIQLSITHLINPYTTLSTFDHSSVMTKDAARYLRHICVQHVSLVHNFIFFIEAGALLSRKWYNCIRTLDLSENPMQGEHATFFQILFLGHLEIFKLMNSKCLHVHSTIASHSWNPTKYTYRRKVDTSQWPRQRLSKDTVSINSRAHKHILNFTSLSSHFYNLIGNFRPNQLVDMPFEINFQMGNIILFLPKNITIINLDSQSPALFHFDMDVNIRYGEKLRELHLADNGIRIFTASIKGLKNLILFDISKNNGSVMSNTFFDWMPSILFLNMACMNLNPDSMGYSSKRIFKSLKKLSTLDLSMNGLTFLSPDTFETNTNLSILDLANNRFHSIPIDINLTPKLCSLDLRKNSLRTVSFEERTKLDTHAEIVKSFSLKLSGNEFYCGCKDLRFLAWIQRTKIDLDNNGNYSCILDTGIRINTKHEMNLEGIWRRCVGITAFWASLLLGCIYILGFMCAMVIPKFKTQFKIFLLKSFWSSFNMKTPTDYSYGVYIGYSDHETSLACRQLRRFVENELHLTTYVRHRDLLPGSDMAKSIMESVNSSWRVLLVISENFLDDPWFYYLLKASTYAVRTENPGRIVFIVIDDNTGKESVLVKLPQCALQAVREESIVLMSPEGHISYEDKEALKTALLDHDHVLD